LSTSSDELAHEAPVSVSQPERQKAGKPRNIYNCNFRSAGRLSNEDARLLTSMHEGLAQHASTALDAYLGISVEVKLDALEQPSIRDHIAELPTYSYIVPLA
jgi:flagellar motor switch protein FliM